MSDDNPRCPKCEHRLSWCICKSAEVTPTDTELLDTAEREGWDIEGIESPNIKYWRVWCGPFKRPVEGPTLRAALTEAWRATGKGGEQ